MYGGSVKVGLFLQRKILWEAVSERAEMLDLNFDWVVPGFINL